MQALNLPAVPLKTRTENKVTMVFDVFRNRWVVLTPEENVRQHLLHYLVNEKNYPKGLIAVEKKIDINQLSRRYDAVCYTKHGAPNMLVECKAPGVAVSNETFLQIAHYNTVLKVPLLLVSNGMSHYICRVNFTDGEITFLPEIPPFGS